VTCGAGKEIVVIKTGPIKPSQEIPVAGSQNHNPVKACREMLKVLNHRQAIRWSRIKLREALGMVRRAKREARAVFGTT
jgi:hypothetical protein